jgi:hypothetical protein
MAAILAAKKMAANMAVLQIALLAIAIYECSSSPSSPPSRNF